MDDQVPPKEEKPLKAEQPDTNLVQPDTAPEPETEDFNEASRSTADFVNSVAPIQEKKQRSKKPLKFLLIVLVLAGLGAGGYFAYKSMSKPEPAARPQTTQPQTTNTAGDTELSEHYKSEDLKLAFDHPKSWKVTDSTSGQVKLTSPIVKLKGLSGAADGKIVMTILGNPVNLTGFSAASTAVLDSEKIAYTSPTQSQRQETFLSFISSSSASSGTGIDAVFITGDSGYKKGQPVPKTEVSKVQPIVFLQFFTCEATCEGEGSGPLTLQPDDWAGNTTLQTAKSILRSLVIE